MGDHRRGAGVVDQEVEPSVVGDRLFDEAGAVRSVGDVGLHVGGVTELGGQRAAGVDRRHRVDDDGGAGGGEPVGGGRADAR